MSQLEPKKARTKGEDNVLDSTISKERRRRVKERFNTIRISWQEQQKDHRSLHCRKRWCIFCIDRIHLYSFDPNTLFLMLLTIQMLGSRGFIVITLLTID